MPASELAAKACIPCKGGVPPLKGEALQDLERQLGGSWRVVDEHHLEKDYKVERYGPAVDFANKVAKIAEEQDHHPDIMFTWGLVRVTIWTHKIDGLTESDFVFAAKAEAAFEN